MLLVVWNTIILVTLLRYPEITLKIHLTSNNIKKKLLAINKELKTVTKYVINWKSLIFVTMYIIGIDYTILFNLCLKALQDSTFRITADDYINCNKILKNIIDTECKIFIKSIKH